MGGRDRLGQTRERFARWRAQHGGPGIAVPEALWAEAVEVARRVGVDATARALRLNRSRLVARMTTATMAADGEVDGGFVELEAWRLGRPPRTVVCRTRSRSGHGAIEQPNDVIHRARPAFPALMLGGAPVRGGTCTERYVEHPGDNPRPFPLRIRPIESSCSGAQSYVAFRGYGRTQRTQCTISDMAREMACKLAGNVVQLSRVA